MIENPTKPQPDASADPEETVSPADAAIYIYGMCRELAAMAREAGLRPLAQMLEQTSLCAADVLVEARPRS